MSRQRTHRIQILQHLRRYRSINPMVALDNYGCYRLAARICELRGEGVRIRTTMKTHDDGAKYAEYTLQ